MTIEEMTKLAHEHNHHCIVDMDGDICIRPRIFDDEGKEELQYQPDPCEFLKPDKAEARLLSIAQNDPSSPATTERGIK